MARIYVSSTYLDLKDHREAVYRALRSRHDVVCMEDYVAKDERPLDRCLADVRACDLYIGLFAFRYGFIPKGKKRAITELEYREAKAKERLCFVVDPEAHWPLKFVDPNRTQIEALKAQLMRSHACQTFTTPDEVARMASEAVRKWEEERGDSAPAPQTLALPFDLTRYAAKMSEQYGRLALEGLLPPERDEGIELRLPEVFVEAQVRSYRHTVELPKETWERLQRDGDLKEEDLPAGVTLRDIERARDTLRERPSEPLFDALSRPESSRAVVLGDPGAGKSSLTRYILLSLLSSTPDPRVETAFGRVVPVLVELREFVGRRSTDGCRDVFEFLDLLGRTEGRVINGAICRAMLVSGTPVLLVFDGLDEIFDPKARDVVMRQIAGIASEYPQARVLVTSRIVDYTGEVLHDAGFGHLTLQDLDRPLIERFAAAWYRTVFKSQPAEAEIRSRRILAAVDGSTSIRQVAGNPMLLTIMAIIAKQQELPRDRAALYEHAASVLVQHWDVQKRLRDERLDPDLIGKPEKFDLLRRIAWSMQSAGKGLAGNYISGDHLRAIIEGFLESRFRLPPDQAKRLSEALIHQLRDRNFILCRFGGEVYGFIHRALLEFFSATAIVERFEKKQELTFDQLRDDVFGAHWQHAEWREVLRLVSGMIDPAFAGRVIDFLANVGRPWPAHFDEDPPRDLSLAVECLNEVRNVAGLEDVGERLLHVVLDLLRHGAGLGHIFLNRFLERELVPAVSGIGPRWPGRRTSVARLVDSSQLPVWWPTTELWFEVAAYVFPDDTDLPLYALNLLATHNDGRVIDAALSSLAIIAERGAIPTALLRHIHESALAVASGAAKATLAKRINFVRLLSLAFRTEPGTLALLRDIAVRDTDSSARGTAFHGIALETGNHRIGLIVSRDLDGRPPFLDPRQPITTSHLEEAQAYLSLPDGLSDKLIEELNTSAGWDVRVGCGVPQTRQRKPSGKTKPRTSRAKPRG